MKTITRATAAALALALSLSTTLADNASPASAAYPTSPFSVTFKNTQVVGTFTWYNRSVGIKGVVRVTSGQCRWALFSGLDANYNFIWNTPAEPSVTKTDEFTNGYAATQNFSFEEGLEANVPGGAANIRVDLYDCGEHLLNYGTFSH